MSSEKPLKLTCLGTTKRHAYIIPSIYVYELRNNIVQYLFGSGEECKHDFRVYWIDEDNDEIDIVNQKDYEIFLRACKDRLHLYATSKNEDVPNKNQGTAPKTPTEGMFPTASVHTYVECNNCMMKPLVGFRYKCVECHDYDLCQSCEAKHVHAEHMMVRMPNADCPNLIEAWVTGRSKRSHKRAGRSSCPFYAGAPETANQTTPGGGDSERHHRRSHKRRDVNSGVFGHLYKIMYDLAEGGVQVNEEAAANAANAAAESAQSAASTAANAAVGAASAAAGVATTAARIAAETLAENAAKEKKTEQTTNTGAKPKSPQSTPKAGTPNNSEPNSVPVTPSLENLAQYIDPQYMRTGIEILNNFSEMFAKMLDPEDGVGMTCPLDIGANKDKEARKNSATSTTSTNSKATSTNVEQSNVGSQVPVEKETENEVSTSTSESSKNSIAAESSEQRRSQSIDDNDWQMIDQQPTTTENAGTDTPPAKTIDYAQLSKDLKAHIDDEQKRQEESQQLQAAATQTTSAAAAGPNVAPTAPLAASIPQNVAQPVAPTKTAEEKRGVLFYHPDPRINNSVHAMIAMGFSNEGDWLTQLLESVNGSIADALDLMNAAQRNNN